MGTSNFHYENVLYTVTDGDEDTWDDTRSNVSCELENDRYWLEDDKAHIERELRSFGATSIGYFEDSVFLGQEEVLVRVTAMTRSGYYEGFNLDYEVRIEHNYSDYEDGWDTVKDLHEWFPSLRGMATIHRDTWIKRIDDKVKEFTDRLEEVYKMYSDHLEVVAVASNGETFYKEVEDV